MYELAMGGVGVVLIDWFDLNEFFGIECIEGVHGMSVWDEPSEMPGEIFLVLHTVIIIMYSTLQYIVFYMIPFRFNRIKKTNKEVSHLYIVIMF